MKSSRRGFLQAAGAASLFSIAPARVLWGETAPSNQLTRALIGFGCIAHSANHLPFKGSRLIGLCDPWKERQDYGLVCAEKNGWGKVKAYKNFMALLADKDVDIAHICTPPHWHGCMSVMAANAGKDIWCEKPMTRTVGEGKRVMEVVKAKKRMFRLNTWFRFQGMFYGFGTTVEPIRQVVENDLLGKGPMRWPSFDDKSPGSLWNTGLFSCFYAYVSFIYSWNPRYHGICFCLKIGTNIWKFDKNGLSLQKLCVVYHGL